MALEQTTKVYIFVDGDKIGRVQDVTATNESGKIDVLDIEQGLAGFAVGAGKTTLKFTMYVPIGGLEQFNFWDAAGQYGGVHECQLVLGAQSYISEGTFKQCEITGTTDKETQCSVEFTGQPKNLE